MTIRIAIIGFGKIARDQHAPAIAANPDFQLVAVANRSGDPGAGVPCFADPADLFRAMSGQLDAVAICTPPAVRHAIARDALAAGLAVLLEKPPAATLGEIEDLEQRARETGGCIYAAWHSQHAPMVGPAADLLRTAKIAKLTITWYEDVRKWHAGQDWIWEPSGFGVFDPGINALSIATAILPQRLFVREAVFEVPANRQSPIAAEVEFEGDALKATFDWRARGGEEWSVAVETKDGQRVELREGGGLLLVDGVEEARAPRREYASIYARFGELVAARKSEVDREPMRIVADAFLVARRTSVDAFVWTGQG